MTVVLLLSLAVTSIIGTVIPQNKNYIIYFREYGEFLYGIFNLFDIFDMYHSWWFQLLLLLLAINIVVCSIDRFPATWKIVAKKSMFDVSRFRRLSSKEEVTVNRSPAQLIEIYKPFIAKVFGYCRVEQTDEGVCVFGEKGGWSRLGVYTVHLSVVFLLFGGLIGSIFGFEGFVNIPEGEKTEYIRIKNAEKRYRLDFEIRCDDFNVSFYDSGSPSEYRSTLTLIEQGKPVLKKDIIVNDPLRYKGINIFQSSYGMLPPEDVALTFKNRETGMEYNKNVTVGREFDAPENIGKFIINDYRKSGKFMGHDIGETFTGILTRNTGSPVEIILPLRFPSFDRMRNADFVVSITDYKSRYYTGLQITKDPGVLVVYTGFVIMIAGCFITFFLSHQRVCIDIIANGPASRVVVSGISNKNRLGMQQKVKQISKNLARLALTA